MIDAWRRTLYVGNVPFEATRETIEEKFEPFGTILNIIMPKNFDNSPRGYAYVEFSEEEEAQEAQFNTNRGEVMGVVITVEFARPSEEEAALDAVTQWARVQRIADEEREARAEVPVRNLLDE
eukprot:gnl/Chilomastix_cuspidata/4107.p3 GENE.gnl/Chilomastix_cuspidata/4107~~gnl/Chilomastix_cuspidata/4107.p3  ORF type:complete len:123 (+),score=29.30 gnl/Chilomastix_cuspidata/4107:758-1126(+)